MKKPALILFDCDGVLIDSELISAESASHELALAGMKISPKETLQRFLGKSRKEIAETARLAGYTVPPDFVERLEARIRYQFETKLRAIDSVRSVLDRAECKICVASGSSLAYIQQALALTNLESPFEGHLFSALMVSRPKPAPDLFLYAAAAMGVEPQDCVVVEDSPSGIAAAKSDGMFVIGFTGGSHLKDDDLEADYLALGCGAVFESMVALGRYLGDLVA